MTDILVQKLQEADTDHLITAAVVVLLFVFVLIQFFFKLPKRHELRKMRIMSAQNKALLRSELRVKRLEIASANIKEKGWPPAHLNAMGEEVEFEPVPEVEEEE